MEGAYVRQNLGVTPRHSCRDDLAMAESLILVGQDLSEPSNHGKQGYAAQQCFKEDKNDVPR